MTINKEWTVFYHVTPSFFATMGIPLRRGRLLMAGDRGAVLVSETLARRRWPGADPIGQTFDEATVVGVVGDARSVRISDGSTTECYRPIEAVHLADAVMLGRVAGAPADTSGIIGSLARTVDPRMAPTVTLLTDALQEKLETPRQVAMIASALGLCALLLAVTGLGGMISFTVSQRLKEIGVRIALGARPVHITRAMARQFTLPVAVRRRRGQRPGCAGCDDPVARAFRCEPPRSARARRSAAPLHDRGRGRRAAVTPARPPRRSGNHAATRVTGFRHLAFAIWLGLWL